MGAALRCGAQASHCSGFSCCRAQALEHRLSSCGFQAYLSLGMWDLPGPRIGPVSPVLAGRFVTTGPPNIHENFLGWSPVPGEEEGIAFSQALYDG